MIVRTRFSSQVCLFVCIHSLLLIGCSGNDDGSKIKLPPLGTVQGVVKLYGKPLENAFVDYFPADMNGSSGKTDKNGAYTLIYNASANGATIGEHTVRIYTKPGGALGSTMEELVPAKFNVKSELKATVKAGDNKIDFDIGQK